MKPEEKKAKEIFSRYVRLRDCLLTTGSEDYAGEWSGRSEIIKFKKNVVKIMLLSKSGPYSYCGPFLLFYKIKGE